MKNKILISCLVLFFAVNHLFLCARADEAGHGKANVKAWKENQEAGHKAMAHGQAQEAEASFEKALVEAEQFDAKDHRLAESLEDLGAVRLAMNNAAGAEPLLRRAAAILRGSANAMAEAQCLIYLGYACQSLQHFDDAEQCFVQAMEMVETHMGRDHPLSAIRRFDLAVLYEQRGEYAKAEPLLKSALELFRHPVSKAKFEEIDPTYGSKVVRWKYRPNYNYAQKAALHLVAVYLKQGLPEKAEACLKESVKLAEEKSGASSPDVQMALGNLVEFYLTNKNYAQAEVTLTRLERLQEKSSEAGHPAHLKTLQELGSIYEQESKPTEAEAAYRKCLTTAEKAGAGDSEEALGAASNLGALLIRQEHYEQAEPVYQQIRERVQKLAGGNLRTVPILTQLAIIYAKLGRDADLEKVYQQQIAVYEQMFGPNHKTVAKSREDYALLLHKEKRDAEAETQEAKARTIRAAK